ncbi:MAG: tRNA (N6-threonylcarbamoyladenosine(37)-N6)-methyltransferase TrmO [Gammaproteobacteria bacterium]|nr:MAG: tRNA (N6-threonylcarbamoyladenosine(37)-N6)-methyltransferase TrmO [Gammaproteobacteria bacterium]
MSLQPVGWLHTPYSEKFGTPRQPGLVPCTGYLVFADDIDPTLATRELNRFSHIWLIFWFHQAPSRRDQALVRPPRLGGNQKVGVFASRSPFRPNPLGLTLVKHRGLAPTDRSQRPALVVESPDLVDGTPILDIKPYLSYAEAIPDALTGFAPSAPKARLDVQFTPQSEHAIKSLARTHPDAHPVIREVIAQDPRPAYRQQDEGEYGVRLFGWNVRFSVRGHTATVTTITP